MKMRQVTLHGHDDKNIRDVTIKMAMETAKS